MSRKVIITCAVTGAIHTPSMSKALPVTPQEIADAAIGAAEAGAAIVHLHARNPKTGQEVPISPRRVLVFRASHALKHQINNGLGQSNASVSAPARSGAAKVAPA